MQPFYFPAVVFLIFCHRFFVVIGILGRRDIEFLIEDKQRAGIAKRMSTVISRVNFLNQKIFKIFFKEPCILEKTFNCFILRMKKFI
jgi:hypothetical protein